MIETDPGVIHPDELLARVRQHLSASGAPVREPARSVAGGAEADMRLLEENVRQLHGSWSVSGKQHLTSHRRRIGKAIVFGKKAVRKLLRWYVEERWGQQVSFNGAATRAISDLMRLSATGRAEFGRLSERLGALEAAGPSDDLQALTERLEALGQEVQALKAKEAGQAGAIAALREENMHLASRLRRIKREGAVAAPQAPAVATDATPELDYLLFENRFRGSREEIMGRMAHYLPDFEPCFDGQAPVLDIGCGRGEMVELLLGRGVRVLGVELNEDMAEFCAERGLPVILGDGIRHLESLEDGSLGAIFVSQVVEHLGAAQWFGLLELARRKLRFDGVFIAETINPGSFFALANAFYKDLTHIRPIHPDTLKFSAESVGFRQSEIRMLSPHPALHLGDGREGTQALLETVFGHQDYALVARR